MKLNNRSHIGKKSTETIIFSLSFFSFLLNPFLLWQNLDSIHLTRIASSTSSAALSVQYYNIQLPGWTQASCSCPVYHFDLPYLPICHQDARRDHMPGRSKWLVGILNLLPTYINIIKPVCRF